MLGFHHLWAQNVLPVFSGSNPELKEMVAAWFMVCCFLPSLDWGEKESLQS